MVKAYIVGFGEYSGRYNQAVYTSFEAADAVARSRGDKYEPGWVDEVDLNPPLDEEQTRHIRPGERLYYVVMEGDGSGARTFIEWDKESSDRFGVAKDNSKFSGECWATSSEHAIKIINDRRAQWIALGKPVKEDPKNQNWYVGVYNE